MMRISQYLMILFLLIACDAKREKQMVPETSQNEEDQLVLTQKEVLDDLIAKKFLRIDINFGTFRNSGEFINDEELPESDSSVGCRLVIHNHSRQDVVLDGDSFSNYLNYEVIDMETGEPVPCLSPTPVSREVSPFMLKPDSGLEFLVRYGAYWCFFGISTDDDDVVYEMPGRFKIYHELIPNDFTIFSVSRDGIVMQEMDLKIYDFHE